ncbi:MAG: HupE/UreJ family protein [Acidobacteriota bacterium]
MQYQTLKEFFIVLVAFPAIMFFANVAEAHDPGLSAANVKLGSDHIVTHLAFSRSDIETFTTLDTNQDGQITDAEFQAARPKLETIIREGFEILVNEGRARLQEVEINYDESNAVNFVLQFSYKSVPQIAVQSPLLNQLPRGHRQYLAITNIDGKVIAEKMLTAGNHVLTVNLALVLTAIKLQSFSDFFRLGIDHILTGYDHLAFLFALLVVGTSFRQAAKIITSFTVAHSLTLALATFGVVRFSANLVEPLIAASIIYVGIENLFRKEVNGRWLLTFGFGLIHGFGFASVLSELGIAANKTSAFLPLLSFNLGVEIGQVAIAVVVLPLIWKLRKQPVFTLRYVPAASLLLAILGGFWLIERTFF